MTPNTMENVSFQASLKRNPANFANIFLLDVNFENLTVGFHVLYVFNRHVKSLQQNVFLAMNISEEIFFVAKNTALVMKYEFRH